MSLLDYFGRGQNTGPATMKRSLEDTVPGRNAFTDEQLERAEKNREEALARKKLRGIDHGACSASGALPSVGLEESWTKELADAVQGPTFLSVTRFVDQERQRGKVIYPASNLVFHAFKSCTFRDVRVVIIGQDPYHGPGQAHGLCFSVPKGVSPPPSLQNIFSELSRDIPGFKTPAHGCLESWSTQGVLLLNAVLTVEAYKAGSHASKGWEKFTDSVIECVNRKKSNVVFLLWGAYAKAKGKGIDKRKHKVLEASHPSPLSANRGGWFGCKHFSKTNEFLRSKNLREVDWKLP